MRRYFNIFILAAAFLFPSGRAYAQRDVETFIRGNSLQKIISIYGSPLEREEFDGESGYCTTLRYQDFYVTILHELDRVDGIIIFSDKLCVLSSVIPGGIKVGDDISKYKYFDFTSKVTGKHYEANGFVLLSEPYREYPSKREFNYGILSKGHPYRIRFAVESGIIREILLDFLDDYPQQDIEGETNVGHTITI